MRVTDPATGDAIEVDDDELAAPVAELLQQPGPKHDGDGPFWAMDDDGGTVVARMGFLAPRVVARTQSPSLAHKVAALLNASEAERAREPKSVRYWIRGA